MIDYSSDRAMVLDPRLKHHNNAAMHAHLGISHHAFQLAFVRLQELRNYHPTRYISGVEVCDLFECLQGSWGFRSPQKSLKLASKLFPIEPPSSLANFDLNCFLKL